MNPDQQATPAPAPGALHDLTLFAPEHAQLYKGMQQIFQDVLAETLQRLANTRCIQVTIPGGNGSGLAPPSNTATCGEALTRREYDVLERVAAGNSNKAIARDLNLSPHTVKRHVANVLGKLGAKSRFEAGAWSRAHGEHATIVHAMSPGAAS